MLVIENRGKGFIGNIGSDWRISQNGSPAILGDQAGRLGSLTFSAHCDSTSKFTIDNYLSVKHYFDNSIDRWLSSFDGHVRSVETDGKTGRFTMGSLLSTLDVERTSSVDVAGTYQRTIDLPVGEEYEILGVPYTIGGYWTSIGSENVFVPRPTIIWDVATTTDFFYVLCAGQHLGEVIVQMTVEGRFYSMWPVYSDATDLASPDSRYIAVEGNNIWVAQVNADRVKQFNLDGTFVTQWGSAGSADGQFNTISGMAVSQAFNAIYITDSVLGRIQCFTEAGVFNFKWGTLGTGTGNLVFNAPNGVSCDPVTGDVLVSDRNARVRAYTSGGGYISQVMGSYNFSTSTSTGEFLAGGYYIDTAFDHLGNAYALQLGKIFKYVKVGGAWTLTSGKPIRQWDSHGIDDLSPPTAFAVSFKSGIMFVARSTDKIDQYAASLGNLKAYWLYYVALASPNLPVRILDLGDEFDVTGLLNFISWTGNVWQYLCDLCAVTSTAMVAFDDEIFLLQRTSRSYRLPLDATITPVRFDSRAAGRSVEIVNWNSRYTVGQEVLYSAEADNQRTFGVDINSFMYVNVSQNTYPEFVNNPLPSLTTGNGLYTVVDTNGLIVDPTLWTNYGGAVRASIGEKPGIIVLNITGPGLEIPGYESPYKIATISGGPSLSVTGAGVVAKPEVLTIGTGISEEISSRAVGQSIDSPFTFNAEVAYSEGSWAAYNMGTPNQRFSITFRVDKTNGYRNDEIAVGGTGLMVGNLVEHDDAQYIVETLDYDAVNITLGVYRYTKLGWEEEVGVGTGPRPEEIWGGKTAGEFDAYWAGYTAQDFTIAPLRNPFGV